jgi:four helix bundle protein
MTKQEGQPRKNDLTERTACFGESVIAFVRRIKADPVTSSLIDQLVRSGTSVGANYCEADDAESKKDFRHKISICLKEIKETKHWLRMLAAAAPELKEEARVLWQEAKELTLIFAAIRRSCER